MAARTITLGCRLNGVESEAMRVRAEAASLAEAAGLAGAADLADATIVNTCAVTAEAMRRSGQAVRRAARERPGRPLLVTGCAAEIAPERFRAIPGVTGLVPNRDKLGLGLKQSEGAPVAPVGAASDATAGRVRAFVQVQTGCDHRCTFCIIPLGRGASRSAPPGEVIAACRAAVEAGAREVVLTGVDLTAYGADLAWSADIGDGPTLGRLVRLILREVADLPRLRLSSIDSVEADPDLIRALAEEPRLMPHLHLSLQAGDDLVLKRMKRRHARADAIAFCREARRLRPDIVFGADLIAGFPTESEEMFRGSLDLVEACGLTYLHVFPYSPRPGTPAARMPQVAPAEASDRAARLRQAGEAALARYLETQVGRTLAVLVENPGSGRTEGFAPARFASPAPRGEIVRVVPSGHDGRVLLAG